MKKKGSRIFITGSKGFIGLNLIKALRKNSHNKVVVYNKDVCDKIRRKNDFDVIFHLAANTDTRYPDDIAMYRNNILGFLSILDFALKNKSKLIYASSASLYGNYRKTAYAKSKTIIDEIARHFFDQLPIVGLRFFNVYGPYEKQKGRMASMVTQWALQLINGDRPKVFKEERKTKRDFIYVKDVVKALKMAIKTKNGIYDVGTGKPRTFDDVLRLVQKNLGIRMSPIYISNPYKDRYQRFSKAKLNWKFKPDYSLEEGIQDYLNKNFY
jgi:ADP-L-glycero-D-manno-heptose 6-epimerase